MALSSKVKDGDGGIVVILTGAIDELSEPAHIVPRVAATMLFDLDGVDRVTSYGVVNWLAAMKKLGTSTYGFAHCRPSVVRQLNMITGFACKGQVLSVYLPFFCGTCRDEYEQLLDLTVNYVPVSARKPPVSHCPKCGKQGEFDDAAETYFSFGAEYGEPRLSTGLRKLWPMLEARGGTLPSNSEADREELRAMRSELQAMAERLKKHRGERGS